MLFVAVVKLLYVEAFLVRLVFQSLEMGLASQSPELIAEVMLVEVVVGAGVLPGDASPEPCPTSYISAGSEKSGLRDTNAAGSAKYGTRPVTSYSKLVGRQRPSCAACLIITPV